MDGIFIVPELIGERAAGRKQEEHTHLYWEFGRQKAVRIQNWKGMQPASKAPWELYDLSADISEEKNSASEKPNLIAKMIAIAEREHEP